MTAQTIRLSRIARVVNGGTPTSDPEYWEGDVPWATPVDLGANHGSSLRTTLRALTPAGVAAGSTIVPARSVLVSTRAPIGYIAINEVPMAFNQGVKALVPDRQTDAAYLAYALHANAEALQSAGQGSTFYELSTGALASTRVPVAHLEQQRRIAEFLDRETAQIDELIVKQEQITSTLAERRATEASELLRTQVTAADQPQVRAKTLWRVIDERAAGLDLPLLSVSIHDGVRRRDEVTDDLPRAEDLSNYKTCLAGDIVINRMRAFQGALGLAPIAGLVSPDYLVVRPNDRVVAEWLRLVMKSNWFVGEMTSRLRGIGTTDTGAVRTPRINASDIGEIRLSLPSTDEQSRTARALESSTRRTIDLERRAESMVGLLRERRQALISAAVTGQIDVGGAS